jgi:hypothetical protein
VSFLVSFLNLTCYDAIFVVLSSSYAAGKKSSDISQPFSSPLYLDFLIFREIPFFQRLLSTIDMLLSLFSL